MENIYLKSSNQKKVMLAILLKCIDFKDKLLVGIMNYHLIIKGKICHEIAKFWTLNTSINIISNIYGVNIHRII